MVIETVGGELATEAAAGTGVPARKPWSAPRLRSLKTSAAENGPNFPTADGIEGQS